MDVVLVANPRSGSASTVTPETLVAPLRRIGPVAFVDVSEHECEAALRRAARPGSLVVAAGGDGTINSTVNTLSDRLDDVAFAFVPLGTANDVAAALGIDGDPTALAEAIADARELRLDVARARGDGVDRLFVNSALGGFPATVGKELDDGLKERLGTVAFWVGGLRSSRRMERFQVRIDGAVVDGCVAVMVGNGRSSSGFTVWPDAKLDDGLLDVCAFAPSGVAAAARLVPLIKAGTHLGRDGVVARQAARLELQTDPAIELSVDGEFIGLHTPAAFDVAAAIRVRAPQ